MSWFTLRSFHSILLVNVRKKLNNLPRVIFISLKGTDPSSFKFFSHSILSPETEERKKENRCCAPPPPPEFRWLSTSTENKDCTAQFCTQFNTPNYSGTLSSGFPSFQEVLCSFFCTDQYFVSLLHTCPLFWLFFFFPKRFPLSMKQTMTFVRKGEPVGGSEFKSY